MKPIRAAVPRVAPALEGRTDGAGVHRATVAATGHRLRSGRSLSGEGPVKLSLLMPAYNEEQTIAAVAGALLSQEYPVEIELIIVDDGSSDRTPLHIAQLDDPRVITYRHPRNFGKGAALLTAAQLASGTHVLPFDADLEYSPADIPRLVEPVLAGRCDVVYGSRLFGANTVYQSYRFAMGNKMTTLAANLLFDAHLADMHTCLKLVPLALFRSLRLKATGFGLDTELTARLLRVGIRPFEVPVSYHSRSHTEGKKLTWHDGVGCLLMLARVRFGGGPRSVAEVLNRTAPGPRQGHEVGPHDGRAALPGDEQTSSGVA
ncbi:glycosyltransferase family 2 protein [Kitasatospora sp. RB6PN24]|uniref:glycosyltransferase family 2 protein n=1 Tax=Kitasatospora humi TaxID=2893891 RepID=UPI001E458057|nr:glycosyltransferase family 2 protein [Kitasatospora humi]MCC9308205.1 glycosyltransferase family 2 protein [Kitasatospora humi]